MPIEVVERAPQNSSRTVADADAHQTLFSKIESRGQRIGIIDLGYVGLPLARTLASYGCPALGFRAVVDPVATVIRA